MKMKKMMKIKKAITTSTGSSFLSFIYVCAKKCRREPQLPELRGFFAKSANASFYYI